MSKKDTIHLPKGYALTITADAVSNGTYVRLGDPGGTRYTPAVLAASSSVELGPFDEPRDYALYSDNGQLTSSQAFEGFKAYDDELDVAIDSRVDTLEAGNSTVTSNVGTAATGVTAVEYGDGYQHTTVLTVDTTLPAIAGGADLAVGKLLYTLPAGACIVDKAYMSLAITQSEGNINADTPDGGLGTTIASGVVAVLGGTAAFENIITGQTFDDCNGTAETVTVSNSILSVESGDNHTIYFNVADGWAASGDAAAGLAGTVVLHWQFMN